jgi:hypothetical protein
MAGRLTISTLNNDTGVLATQNGMTGIAKAWVSFQGGGGGTTAGNILGSFNVSSITVNGTADYTVNFTTAMPNTNYVISGSSISYPAGYHAAFYIASASGTAPTTYTTSACRINTRATDGNVVNTPLVNCAIFSS